MTNEHSDSVETKASSVAPAKATPPVATTVRPARKVCCLLAIVIATTVVFGQVAWHDFLTWDDDVHVTSNPLLNPVSAASLKTIWSAPYEGLYVPLSYTFFAAEASLPQDLLGANTTASGSHLNPRLFHIGNLALHVICGVLVFLILLQLVGDEFAACCGAIAFCVHPVQVEAVAWISESRGLLAACLSLLSIRSYLKFATSEGVSTPSGEVIRATTEVRSPRFSRLDYVLAMLWFFLALLAKPTAVAVPLILAVIDTNLLGRSWKRSATSLAGWLVLAAVFAVVTKSEQSTATMAFIPSIWTRPLIAGDALAFYLLKVTVPMGLAFDYGRTPARVMETFWFYVAWTIPVALFLIVRFRIRHAMTKVSLVIFFAGLLPVLGFVAFGFQDISTVADRYLYLPMLGVSLIVAAMLSRIQHAVKIPGIVVCLLLLAILSGRQARYWQDNSSLYARGLAVNPQSFVACNNLGNLLLKKNQLDQAAAMFSRALVIKPSHATSHYNLGLALTRNGQPEAAIREFRQGITILQVRGMAVKAEMYFDLAVSLEKIGRLDDAETQYRNALDAAPAMARARLGLGNVYYAMGNADSAGTQFRRALKAQPDFTAAKIRLADMLLIEKAYPEAIQLYNSALQERPEDMPRIQLNLGIVFSLMGQLDDAVAQLDDAHAMLERERNSEMASQLARAWFELSDQLHFQGDVTEAIACLQKALRLVPADSVPAHEIQKRATEFATPDQPRKQ